MGILPLIVLLLLTGSTNGCYYVGPRPVAVAPGPSTSYEAVWDNALRAAEDVGIEIGSVDNRAGMIYGKRGSTDVKVVVIKQYDGRTRVELEMKGPQQHTKALADDFYSAYDGYMGR